MLDAPFIVLACTGSILLGLCCARLCALKILIFFNQGFAILSGNTGTATGLHCNNLVQETKTSNSDNTTNPINGHNLLLVCYRTYPNLPHDDMCRTYANICIKCASICRHMHFIITTMQTARLGADRGYNKLQDNLDYVHRT